MRMLGLTRREFLGASAGLATLPLLPRLGLQPGRAAESPDLALMLTAAPTRAALVGSGYPETAVWGYNGRVPGPELRLRQGGRLRVVVRNRLDRGTTIHWHGIRVPNAMDGVAYVTQDPIAPGGEFVYEFVVPDAGTFWYHPHVDSTEQVGRGLAGPLIVEEREPLKVDRDITWVLDDWRLTREAAISDDFDHPHDLSHQGRLGNTVTINGTISSDVEANRRFRVRAGERIRLRLINVSNARIFGLRFEGHEPQIIALDGQPVAPHGPADGIVVVTPAQRVDLVIDMGSRPGERFRVIDEYYARDRYLLLDILYSGERPLRNSPLDKPIRLAANPLPEPDLTTAARYDVLLEGGAMGRMRQAVAVLPGGESRRMDVRALAAQGMFWAFNGVASGEHLGEPLLTLERGRSYVLVFRNETAWDHPMHLHGHSFRVIRRDGRPTEHREWRDTVLVAPRETVEVAFVADNPGDWALHCHILGHQVSGMMASIRVA